MGDVNTRILTTAVQTNQEGVDEFACGNLSGALCSFRAALQRAVTFDPPAADTPPFASNPVLVSTADPHALAACGISQAGQAVNNNADDQNNKTEEAPGSYTCRKPFLVNAALLPQTQDGLAVFSGVVIFNMALVFHGRLGVEPSNPTFRTKALQLYESSLDLISNLSPLHDLSGLMCAALNNKANLYFAVGDFESSNQELERLRGFLARSEHSLSTPAILQPADMDGMVLNLLLMRPPKVAQAA